MSGQDKQYALRALSQSLSSLKTAYETLPPKKFSRAVEGFEASVATIFKNASLDLEVTERIQRKLKEIIASTVPDKEKIDQLLAYRDEVVNLITSKPKKVSTSQVEVSVESTGSSPVSPIDSVSSSASVSSGERIVKAVALRSVQPVAAATKTKEIKLPTASDKIELLLDYSHAKRSKYANPVNETDIKETLGMHRSTGLKRFFTTCSLTNSMKCLNALATVFELEAQHKGQKITTPDDLIKLASARENALSFFEKVLSNSDLAKETQKEKLNDFRNQLGGYAPL